MDNFDNEKLQQDNHENQEELLKNETENIIEDPKPISNFEHYEIKSDKKENYRRHSGLSYLA
ncbi:MAG: hypothetical protein K0Q65_3282, partial [Clostridia bacterium]|nr:hypothetical protein [Clostridia bacterium]